MFSPFDDPKRKCAATSKAGIKFEPEARPYNIYSGWKAYFTGIGGAISWVSWRPFCCAFFIYQVLFCVRTIHNQTIFYALISHILKFRVVGIVGFRGWHDWFPFIWKGTFFFFFLDRSRVAIGHISPWSIIQSLALRFDASDHSLVSITMSRVLWIIDRRRVCTFDHRRPQNSRSSRKIAKTKPGSNTSNAYIVITHKRISVSEALSTSPTQCQHWW